MISSTSFRQLASFGAVGVAATATHALAALTAHDALGTVPLVANLVGYAFAAMVSYFGNSLITFGRPALRGAQFIRFMVTSLAALALSQIIMILCTDVAQLSFRPSLLIVVMFVPILTFTASKFWVFGRT